MNEIYIFNAAKLAVKSMILVASVYPKPGLITPLDNSALDSTDYPCYIDGAMSMFQCLVNSASAGSDTEAMNPLKMFPAPKCTHLGLFAVFSLIAAKSFFGSAMFAFFHAAESLSP